MIYSFYPEPSDPIQQQSSFTCYFIELLDIQGLESRDAVELLRKVKQSFYQPDNISNYVFENVTIVHNARFNTEVGICLVYIVCSLNMLLVY
jgi:hypothetical protein